VTTDAKIRGRLLKVVYDLRHSNSGWVPLSDMNMAGAEPVTPQMIDTICQHLADAGLIEWKPLRGTEGIAAGMARIKGPGVDVIEGKGPSTINLTLPGQESAPKNAGMKAMAGEIARPPAFTGVAAKGEAGTFAPDTQSWEVAAQIAARQRGLSAAVRSTTDIVEPLPPLPVGTPVVASPGAIIEVPHATVGAAVLQNKVQIVNTATSLSLLIDDKVAALKAELPNSVEGQTARAQSIADFEDLKVKLEALRNAAIEFAAGKAHEEAIVNASSSFADGVAAWWAKCHVQICEKAYDMWLFGLGISICSLAGSDGQLAVVVSSALVGGKPVAGAIKALLQKK
jgi:hypothetical protein